MPAAHAPRIVRWAVIVALIPAELLAQRGPGGGGFGRSRGVGSIQRTEGIAVNLPINPINLLIEHRQELALTDTQFMHVIVVKRALDSANAPLMRTIDSVQHMLKGGNPIFSQPSPLRRDSLAEGRAAVTRSIVGLRENISDYREKAFALLSTTQLEKAQDIETRAIKAAEDEEQKQKGRGKP